MQAMLDTKLDQYLADVRREAGQDDLTEVTKALADPVKLALAKAAMGL